MTGGIVIGIIGLLAGVLLFRHAERFEGWHSAIHRSIGIVPGAILERMRDFNIAGLRVVAIFWMAIGVLVLSLTAYQFVSE